MARITEYGDSGASNPFENSQQSNTQIIEANQQGPIQVPSEDFIADADITRDGQDLILEAPDGSTIVVEGYFNADPAPMIVAPNGSALTPKMVQSFVQESGDVQVARADSVVDESAVGHVLEVNGEAHVVRADGSTEPLTIGTSIYQGDIIETSDDGAVNIQFIDESTFAVSESARLAIDEYVFDPATESGSTNFSVLRGLFVFTSGLIGRDDPDDVQIDTPVGSIGIRGTIIMGNVGTGEITVVEGAIVLRSFDGNEMTLDEHFETARFEPATGEVVMVGIRTSEEMSASYESMAGVSPALFSGFTGSGGEPQQSSEPALVASAEPQPQPIPETINTTDTQVAQAEPPPTTPPTTTQPQPEVITVASAPTQPALDPFAVAGNTGFDEAAGTSPTSGGTTGTQSGTALSSGTTGSTGTPVNTGGTTTTTATVQPPPLLPLDIEVNRSFVEDSLAVGQTVAVVSTTSAFPDVLFSLVNDYGGQLILIDGPDNKAAIKLASGTLTAGTPIDFAVKATLPDGRTVTEGFNLGVVDTNTAPTVTNDGSTFFIDENSTGGTFVGNVAATDPDAGQTLSYSIISGNVGGAFSIDASGNINVVGALNFEGISSYSLTVRVQDDGFGSLIDTATYTINVNDLNEAPVLTTPGSAFSLSEAATSGAIVADASAYASDVDGGQTLSYAITAGNAGGAFTIDSATGIITVVGGMLDYEATTSYNLTVEATDDGTGTLSDTAIFTVNITDFDDEATILTTTAPSNTVIDGSTTAITTAMLNATDVDTADTGIVYTLTSALTNGQLELISSPGASISSFTQDDLANGRVVYVHDGSGVGTDTFNFDVDDGVNATTSDTFTFTINTAPDVTTPSLETGGTGTHVSGLSGLTVLGTELRFRFDEDIVANAGNIRVRAIAGDAIVDTIAITDPNVTITGNVIKVDLNNALLADTGYYIEMDGGAVEDLSGNTFAGITGSATFNFTTGRGTFLSTVGGLGQDAAHDALELFDPTTGVTDGYIVVGEATTAGQKDIMISSIDNHGFVQDVTLLGNAASDEVVTGIAHNAAGVFIGATTNNVVGAGGDDFMLSSIDLNGNVNWTQTYGLASNDIMNDVTALGASQVVMAGASQGTNDSGLIVNVDGSTGNVIWETILSKTGVDIKAEDVLATSASKYTGDVLVGGSFAENGGDAVIARLDDADGSLQWAYTLNVGTSSVDSLNAMAELGDGSIVMAGSSDFGDASFGNGLLVKMNTDGSGDTPTVDWAVSIGGVGAIDRLTDVIELSDGSIAVVGTVSNNNAFVANFDASGTLLWARSLSFSANIANAESIEQTLDGTLLITGSTNAGSAGSTDAFVFQMTQGGQIQNEAGTSISTGTLGGGWTISNLTGITADVTGNTTIAQDGAIAGADPNVTVANFGTAQTTDGENVDHANDVLGDTNSNNSIVGTTGADFLNDGGNDAVISGFNGDDQITINGFDIVHGGSGNDTIILDAAGKYAANSVLGKSELGAIDGGSGNDFFRLASDNDLDLRGINMDDSRGLHNFEGIDLTDVSGFAQTVTLSYQSILAMTDANNELVINGTGVDSVVADLRGLGFTQQDGNNGPQAGLGTGYEYYTDGTAHLYIQDAVNQTSVELV